MVSSSLSRVRRRQDGKHRSRLKTGRGPPQKRRSILYRQYEKLKSLGAGGYGKVFLAQERRPFPSSEKPSTPRTDPLIVVVKTCQLRHYLDLLRETVFVEHLRRQAPEYFPVIHRLLPDLRMRQIHQVMAPHDYSLAEFQFRDLTNSYVLDIAQQLLEMIATMERHLLSHFDLKEENILVDVDLLTGRPHLTMIDFGFSQFHNPNAMVTAVCTNVYRPPELFGCQESHFGLEVDLWSFGCLMLDYLTKSYVIDGDDSGKIAKKIYHLHKTLPFHLADQIHPFLGYLLRQFLSLDPQKRLDAYDLIRFPLYQRQSLFLSGEHGSLKELPSSAVEEQGHKCGWYLPLCREDDEKSDPALADTLRLQPLPTLGALQDDYQRQRALLTTLGVSQEIWQQGWRDAIELAFTTDPYYSPGDIRDLFVASAWSLAYQLVNKVCSKSSQKCPWAWTGFHDQKGFYVLVALAVYHGHQVYQYHQPLLAKYYRWCRRRGVPMAPKRFFTLSLQLLGELCS